MSAPLSIAAVLLLGVEVLRPRVLKALRLAGVTPGMAEASGKAE